MRWSLFFLMACSATPSATGADGPAAGDFQVLCGAEVSSGAVPVFPFSAKASTLNEWIEKNVSDPGVQQIYFEQMPQTLSTEQGNLLRAEAAKNGVDACPLAGYVEFMVGLSYEAFSIDDCVAACTKRNAGAMTELEGSCRSGCGGDL
jgi:hypothetical protein